MPVRPGRPSRRLLSGSSVSGTSVWILRLGDIRLEPPSRGHPSGSSVSGTSVWILRLRDIRLDPPSRGHPSGSSVLGASVWNLRLRDIRLDPPSRGHPSRPSNHINGSYFNHHSHGNLNKYKMSLILRETCAKRMKGIPVADQSTSSLVFLLLSCF